MTTPTMINPTNPASPRMAPAARNQASPRTRVRSQAAAATTTMAMSAAAHLLKMDSPPAGTDEGLGEGPFRARGAARTVGRLLGHLEDYSPLGLKVLQAVSSEDWACSFRPMVPAAMLALPPPALTT